MKRRPPRLRALPWACLGISAAMAHEAGAPVAGSALQACAVIAAPAPRLACYDQLAGRPASPATAAAAVAAPVQAPVAAAGKAATTPQQAFGLYAAEHPALSAPASLSTKVVGMGSSANGRPTVALEGGQLWELEQADPLLADGDLVTIKRGALGSFLLTTPNGRTHRVRRLH